LAGQESGSAGAETANMRAAEHLARLKELYAKPECALHHENPWQLLCATILSAQCTDARVNMVTPALFARFPTPEAMAAAPQEEVEEVIKSTGFFRQKAQSLISMSQDVVAKFGGEVPRTLEELTSLRGVGRKTANVLIGVAFGGDGVVVDTHVKRLSRLLGWTEEEDPEKIEFALMELHPRAEWTPLAHRLILHGRATCVANRPKCAECTLKDICPEGIRRLSEPEVPKSARKGRSA
jgi:endonuclease-3